MPALSERKIEIVRTLVETAPDKVVGGLQAALAETPNESALGGVRRLVEREVAERTLRNVALQPIAPMCLGAGGDAGRMTFPARALFLLWKGVVAACPETVEHAREAHEDDAPHHLAFPIFDHLTAAAAEGLRTRDRPEFAAAAEACERARPGGAELLASCLDLGPVVRRAIQKLPEWLAHSGGDTSAGARLAYKDAVAISDDAGPRFFHMLAAQMAQPWMVLRIISAVMDKPTERYLADSELASFGEHVIAEIDQALNAIATLNPDEGPQAGRAAARLAALVVQQILEVETSIDLVRESGWGARVAKQRGNLAGVVERRLKEAEKATANALPISTPRLARIRRPVPNLAEPPSPRNVTRAMTLLSFCDEIKATANRGGFASARARLVEALGDHLDHYVDEVVDLLRTGDAENPENGEAYLAVVADFNRLIRDEKAAELVRRRAHAALHPEHPPLAAHG
jgi:hypothetical protein